MDPKQARIDELEQNEKELTRRVERALKDVNWICSRFPDDAHGGDSVAVAINVIRSIHAALLGTEGE